MSHTATEDARYAFVAEWFDQTAQLLRKFLFTFGTRDSTVEMVDMKTRKSFLKKTEYPQLKLHEIFLGARVCVFARQLHLVEYGDNFTRDHFEGAKSKSLAMIKPDAYKNIGNIIKAIYASGLTIARLQMIKLTENDARNFYAEHKGKPFYEELVKFMSSDVVVAMELFGKDAVTVWRGLLGPTNTAKAKESEPQSLRALYGTDGTRNAAHGSDSSASAEREIKFFFDTNPPFPTTAILNNCTCAVVRPHAIRHSGEIVQAILSAGFEISAMEIMYIDKGVAEEFLEVYRGVLPEARDQAAQLAAGPCLVMEVRQENAVTSLRSVVGPHDPMLAKHLRPDTLRAKFGIDRARNAIHCTDLPEDGLLECEYFFRIVKATAGPVGNKSDLGATTATSAAAQGN